jgi:hypothetical protein
MKRVIKMRSVIFFCSWHMGRHVAADECSSGRRVSIDSGHQSRNKALSLPLNREIVREYEMFD